MRKLLFLFISPCFLLPAFLVSCNTTHQAISLTTIAKTDIGKPKFINSVSLNSHNGKQAFTNVTANKNYHLKNSPAANKKFTENGKVELSNIDKETGDDLVIKNNPVPDTSLIAANKIDTLENKEPAGISIRKGEQPELKETNPAPVIENEQAKVDESKTIPAEEVDPMIMKYSGLVSVSPKDITNYPLYRFIDDWYGTEYKWGGSDNTGIDCSAFSQKCYSEVFGIDLLRTTREQRRNSERVKHSEDAVEGDLIFFRIHRFRISHVGVYLTNGFFVHASSSQGVVISNLNDRYWRRRYAGCGRIEREDMSISESGNLQ